MPKLKTSRSAAKRFKRVGESGFKRKKAYHSHILTKKTTKRKRNLRQKGLVDSANIKHVEHLLPYL